jgi:replication factor A1
MSSTKKLKDIASGQQNCKVVGRLTRLWDSRNMRSKSADSLISIDGIIIDENVSTFDFNSLLHSS